MAKDYPAQAELNYVVECEHIENNGELCILEATRSVGRLPKMIFLCDHHARRGEYKSSHVNIKLTYQEGAIKVEEFNRAASEKNHTQIIQKCLRLCKI